MTLKSVIVALVVVFVIFFIVTSPDKAATIAHGGWKDASNIAHGIATFVDKL